MALRLSPRLLAPEAFCGTFRSLMEWDVGGREGMPQPQLPSPSRSKGAYINYSRKVFGFWTPSPLSANSLNLSLTEL